MQDRARAGSTTWAAPLTVAVLLTVAPGCRHGAAPPPDGGPVANVAALIADPPAVRSAELELSDSGAATARLRLRYASGARLPARIPLELDGGPAWIFDDGAHGDAAAGDALYAGDVPIDVAALAAYQAQIDAAQEAAHGSLTVTRFDGRVAVGTVPLASLDLAGLSGGKVVGLSGNWVLAGAIDAQRSLLITDSGVTGDPARTFNGCNAPGGGLGSGLGKWGFGYLMQQAAGTQNPSTFVRNWLAHWESNQSINGFTAKKRSLIKSAIIDPWQQASGAGQPLDLAKAPFRLLAIVNRVDFADGVVYGAGRGGELRFVFGAVRQPPAGQKGGTCGALRFTVIFEYDIGQTKCTALRQWARQWVDLAALVPGSAAYNTALAAITDPITQANAAPTRPNGSALNQIRTNEIALPDLASNPNEQDKAFWDMREFHVETTGLKQTTVAQTPDLSRNRTTTLADYVNTNAATILIDRHVVPPLFPAGVPFLGANALMQPTTGGVIGTFWAAPAASPITDPEARFHFSLNTCNGCHAGETGTNAMHISPLATPPPLSGFLTGTSVADPAQLGGGGTTHSFGDLERRRIELARIANLPCLLQIFRRTLPMVH